MAELGAGDRLHLLLEVFKDRSEKQGLSGRGASRSQDPGAQCYPHPGILHPKEGPNELRITLDYKPYLVLFWSWRVHGWGTVGLYDSTGPPCFGFSIKLPGNAVLVVSLLEQEAANCPRETELPRRQAQGLRKSFSRMSLATLSLGFFQSAEECPSEGGATDLEAGLRAAVDQEVCSCSLQFRTATFRFRDFHAADDTNPA